MAWRWPGNVRELRTAIEHAVVFARGAAITLRDLPVSVRGGDSESPTQPAQLPPNAASPSTVHDAEKDLIMRALKENQGNRTLAAKKIGMSRRTLHRKLHEYHLEGF
jgi:DNA-binding NtrC family response regulator